MGQRILVPVDDSERAKEGLRYALENFPDAEFTALHVVSSDTGDLGAFSRPSGGDQEQADEGDTDSGSASAPGDLGAFPGPGGKSPDQTEEDDTGDPALGMAREIASEHGVEIQTDRMRGRPDRAIVKYLEENEYDLVVLGSHGRDGVARVLLGSVAEKVVRRSPIPVLVVR
ncbi:universal stress protein [Haloarcula halophila]|uniref:universal stress protein n=1 Tax=Haloarcula TaxID=2237 RepID=UPI0023E401E2|nr:universal stress protein [Halomicroarcula sp. DFY41]